MKKSDKIRKRYKNAKVRDYYKLTVLSNGELVVEFSDTVDIPIGFFKPTSDIINRINITKEDNQAIKYKQIVNKTYEEKRQKRKSPEETT